MHTPIDAWYEWFGHTIFQAPQETTEGHCEICGRMRPVIRANRKTHCIPCHSLFASSPLLGRKDKDKDDSYARLTDFMTVLATPSGSRMWVSKGYYEKIPANDHFPIGSWEMTGGLSGIIRNMVMDPPALPFIFVSNFGRNPTKVFQTMAVNETPDLLLISGSEAGVLESAKIRLALKHLTAQPKKAVKEAMAIQEKMAAGYDLEVKKTLKALFDANTGLRESMQMMPRHQDSRSFVKRMLESHWKDMPKHSGVKEECHA